MADVNIFINSTCYDLSHVMQDLRDFTIMQWSVLSAS